MGRWFEPSSRSHEKRLTYIGGTFFISVFWPHTSGPAAGAKQYYIKSELLIRFWLFYMGGVEMKLGMFSAWVFVDNLI